MKIGVLGGTFNPIHMGHLILANEIGEAAALDKVLFIPAYYPPHKTISDMVSGEHRLRMVARAVADNPLLSSSDVELRLKGVSYTIETIKQLRRENPGDDFYFIIGADSVPELASWYKIHELTDICSFLIGERPGHLLQWKRLEATLPVAKVQQMKRGVYPTTSIGISSSMIRTRISQGKSIRYYTPYTVEAYIHKHSLYTESGQENAVVDNEQESHAKDTGKASH